MAVSVAAGLPTVVSAQERRLSFAELDEVYELTGLVDAVADGQLPGGKACLKLSHHLLRGAGGRVYVPFTVTIDEAPGRFRSVGLYVRVANAGEDSSAGKDRASKQRLVGFELGELPVYVPERATGASDPPGTILAGENSTAMRLATDPEADQARYPFEDVHFIDFERLGASEPYRVRRALAVAPGTYDVYIAVREYDASSGRPDNPGTAVIKRTLTIPKFSPVDLSMSGIILADELRLLDAPVTATERVERPYAFGGTEVVPATDPILSSAETLTVAFFIYNLEVDGDRQPSATVRYRLHQQVNTGEEFFGQTAPTELNPETLPEGFDLEAADDQLFTTQMLPLGNFPEGSYRLEILATDNLAERTVGRDLQFIVQNDGRR